MTDEQKQRDLIDRLLTKQAVSQIRTSAALKVASLRLAPSKLIGVIKVDKHGVVYWAAEQRFGFPYQEIPDRDFRRLVWEALEKQDDDDVLRVLILDQEKNMVASIRIPYAPRGEA